ncbi:MAG: bifunctional 2-polyprenyl-6-hydroxyphenol methylase/3-demethylubiquinol 3-O-methyltransferase UbiG [Pseudomonadota bacterium]
MNVNPQEIEKFNALAEQWWDPEGKFRPLHDVNQVRLNYIKDNADGLAGKAVLDVGCGGGILSESMALAGAKVLGTDMGEAPLNVARIHAEQHGVTIDYRHITAEALAEESPGQFDVVTCMEMLEHVPEPPSIIEACRRLCKPGGHVFFSTINRHPKAYLFAILGAEYVLNLLPRGTHDYANLIRPSELCQWSRQAGLTVHDVSGFSYNPLTHHAALTKDVKINYFVHTQHLED